MTLRHDITIREARDQKIGARGASLLNDSHLDRCADVSRTSPRPNRWLTILFVAVSLFGVALTLSGCTGPTVSTVSTTTQLLKAAPSSLTFGPVPLGQTTISAVSLINQSPGPVQISNVVVAGTAFSLSSGTEVPMTLASGATYVANVNFTPQALGNTAGTLTVTSSAADGSDNSPTTMAVGLGGTGAVGTGPGVSALTCASSSFTGAGTDACTITLNALVTGTGLTVNLASSTSTVSVPGTVTVAPGATSASFTATVAAVGTAQSATLSASATGATQTFLLQLGAASPGLSISPSNVSFGNVTLGSAATQSLTLTSTGTEPVTVNLPSVSGAGYSISSEGFPVTLAPGQTATLGVQFDPSSTGAATGQLAFTSNSLSGSALDVGLSGTGVIPNPAALSSLSCARNSITGSAIDACVVSLSSSAGSGGFTVNLSSNNSAVTVPATVTVAQGASSAGFTAAVSPVTTTQSVTLTATVGTAEDSFALQLGASVPILSVSSTSLSFGSTAINSAATQSVTLSSTGTTYVSVNAAAISGAGFSASGASFPLNLSPNQSVTLTVQFDPTAAGSSTGTLTLSSNSSTGSTTVVNLSGAGVSALSGLSCANGSMTAAGTDNCTVSLGAPAGSGGLTVRLASSNSAVSLPASVTVPAGATSANFAATVAAVSTATSVTLTASAGGVNQTFALVLGANSSALNVSTTSLNFGTVSLNSPVTQSLTLSSSSVLPVTVSIATVAGPGFSLAGNTFPLSISTGQSVTFNVVFDPSSAGAASGTLTVLSTSLSNPVQVINLSGTGTSATYQVSLSWQAPTSTDPIVGYNIYRSSNGNGTNQELNSSVITQTTYVDSTVQAGQTYEYVVESVDTSGNTSAPSNLATVAIP